MKKITDRWMEIQRLNEKESLEIAAMFAAIDEKYSPQIAAVPRSHPIFGGKEMVYSKSEEAIVEKLAFARDSEKYTLWRDQIAKMQGRAKTMLADAGRYDELQAQAK
jgi:hypothetical protein